MNHSHRDGKRPCGNAYPCHTRRATLKCTLLSCHPIKPTTQLIFLYGDGKVHFTRSQLPRLSPNAVLRSSIVMAYVRGAPWGSSHLACVRVLCAPQGSLRLVSSCRPCRIPWVWRSLALLDEPVCGTRPLPRARARLAGEDHEEPSAATCPAYLPGSNCRPSSCATRYVSDG